MGTKTISIDEEAYKRLKNSKIGSESFSEVVKRITNPVKKRSMMEFAGIWDLTDEEYNKMKAKLKELRDEFNDLLR